MVERTSMPPTCLGFISAVVAADVVPALSLFCPSAAQWQQIDALYAATTSFTFMPP